MMIVDFYSLGTVDECNISFVVVVAKYRGNLLLVRHRDRLSWEIPGGHVEQGEPLDAAARRELFEETGAEVFSLTPVCTYSVNADGVLTFGQIFYTKITKLGKLPDTEIAEVKLFTELPKNLTYPLIQPHISRKVSEWEKGRSNL